MLDVHARDQIAYLDALPRAYSDAIEADTSFSFDQVFGANYSAGTSLISSFSNYVDEANRITLDLVPSGQVADPWAN